jgi:hypothetical protein
MHRTALLLLFYFMAVSLASCGRSEKKSEPENTREPAPRNAGPTPPQAKADPSAKFNPKDIEETLRWLNTQTNQILEYVQSGKKTTNKPWEQMVRALEVTPFMQKIEWTLRVGEVNQQGQLTVVEPQYPILTDNNSTEHVTHLVLVPLYKNSGKDPLLFTWSGKAESLQALKPSDRVLLRGTAGKMVRQQKTITISEKPNIVRFESIFTLEIGNPFVTELP